MGHAENQARGFQRALNDYLRSTGQDPEQGTRKIADLLERIDAEPLPTLAGRKLTQTLARHRHHPAALQQGRAGRR